MSGQATVLMANEQSFESLNDENFNTSDLCSNRKRKGKGISETLRPGKARRWSDAEVDRSRAIFRPNQYGTG